MTNIVLSTRNIDDFIHDVANEVVKKIELWNVRPSQQPQDEQESQLTEKKTTKKFVSKIERRVING